MKRKKSKKKSWLNGQGIIPAMLGIIGISVGVVALVPQLESLPDLNPEIYADLGSANRASANVTISGQVWRDVPVNTHTITLAAESVKISGRVKEGHPELGCTNDPDPGVHPFCDQNQPTESFDLVCDDVTIYSYRDRGPEKEEWSDVSQTINLSAGRHECEVRHAENGPLPRDGGSVDYELTFEVQGEPGVVCKTVDFSFVPGVPQSEMKEGLPISDQFYSEYGMKFTTGPMSNTNAPCDTGVPLLAEYGKPQFAYQSKDNLKLKKKDKALFEPYFLSARELGDRPYRAITKEACQLNIDVNPARQVTGMSFDILDIDNNESYLIRALGANGQVVDELNVDKKYRRATKQKPNTGNMRPTRVTLGTMPGESGSVDGAPMITKVEIIGNRKKGTYWGYGFDNVYACGDY